MLLLSKNILSDLQQTTDVFIQKEKGICTTKIIYFVTQVKFGMTHYSVPSEIRIAMLGLLVFYSF